MDDYSLANKEIHLVPTLYLRSSLAEYYDWEDAMEDFLEGRGLESHMQLYFSKETFSKGVILWWQELHKGHTMSDEDPCRTWTCMKDVLRQRFGYGAQLQATKQNVHSSWNDTFVRDKCPKVQQQHAGTITYT
jgi:hypothetical protein